MVDELRLILLGIGLLIIGLIYAWGMRARIRERLQNRRREPGLDESDADDAEPEPEPDIWSRSEVRVVPKTETAQPEEIPAETPAVAEPPKHQTTSVGTKPVEAAQNPTAKAAPARSAEAAPKAPAETPAKPSTKPSTATEPAAAGKSAAPTTKTTAARQTPESTPKPAPKPTSRPATTTKAPEWNVVLTLIAPERQAFTGHAIKAAAEQQQLVLGERGIWECLTGDGSERMIFGIAHLREPGTFDPNRLATLRTPGLLLFMPLPGPMEAVPAIDLLIEQAGQLQKRLGGVLCDERRDRLTTQFLLQLRARAETFDEQLQSSSSPATS